jgi:sulfatase maturation enzyme AslB (radical SAM superfamily)
MLSNLAATHQSKLSVGKISDGKSTIEIVNTDFYKLARRSIIEDNKLPPGCEKCSKSEMHGGKSKRISALNWPPFDRDFAIKSLENTLPDGELLPDGFRYSYIELTFDANICNFKCRICNERSSNLIHKENITLGLKSNDMAIFVDDKNQWFSKVLENHASEFQLILITGGEPLLVKKVWEMFDKIADFSNLHRLSFTTNGSITTTRYGTIFEKMINANRKIGVGVSLDAIGEFAEYSRHGTKWESLSNNFEEYLKNSNKLNNYGVSVSCSVSIFSVFWLDSLFEYIQSMCEKHGISNLHIAIGPVTHPEFADVELLPHAIKQELFVKYENLLTDTTYDRIKLVGIHGIMSRLDVNMPQRSDVLKLKQRKALIDDLAIRDAFRKEDFFKLVPSHVAEALRDERFLSDASF